MHVLYTYIKYMSVQVISVVLHWCRPYLISILHLYWPYGILVLHSLMLIIISASISVSHICHTHYLTLQYLIQHFTDLGPYMFYCCIATSNIMLINAICINILICTWSEQSSTKTSQSLSHCTTLIKHFAVFPRPCSFCWKLLNPFR